MVIRIRTKGMIGHASNCQLYTVNGTKILYTQIERGNIQIGKSIGDKCLTSNNVYNDGNGVYGLLTCCTLFPS